MDIHNKRESDVLLSLLISKVDNLDTKLEAHMQTESEKITLLMDTFNTAKHVVWFIKWLAALSTAIGLTWAWVHNHFTLGVK